jgi:hypothetical protein
MKPYACVKGTGKSPCVTAWGFKSLRARHICVYGRHQRGIVAQDGIMTPSGLIGLSAWLAWPC